MEKTLIKLLILISISSISQIKNYTDFDSFEKEELKQVDDDIVYVVNFWATWCAPCVKELPYFESLPKSIEHKNIEVLLVSLDFESQIKKRLIPFVEKTKLKSKVVILTDGNANDWINKINPDWSGAIPATLILYDKKKAFYEKSYHSQKELESDIKKLIPQP